MAKWKSRLWVFSGLYAMFCIWTPVLWFASWARDKFHQNSLEWNELPPTVAAFGLLICAASFVATIGFALANPKSADET